MAASPTSPTIVFGSFPGTPRSIPMADSPTSPAIAFGSFPGTISGETMFPIAPPPTPSDHDPLPADQEALFTLLDQAILSSSSVPTLRLGTSSLIKTRPPAPPVPVVSLDSLDLDSLRAAAAEVGYFHLAGHGIPSQLPCSALAEMSRVDASALLASTLSALGFSVGDEKADGGVEPAMVFDVDEGSMDALPAAAEYARLMRALGLKVVELLYGCREVGFGEEPFAEGVRKAKCLVWVSKVGSGDSAAPPAAGDAKAYPYVVGLHCQWEQKAGASSWVMDDGGEWKAVGGSDGALLVTIGDIAQVWSNGKLKKVRGVVRPTSAPTGDGNAGEPAGRLSITVLITLPLDTVVSPLMPPSDAGEDGEEEGRTFRSFSLENYAWGLYHEQLQFKDPLAQYRI